MKSKAAIKYEQSKDTKTLDTRKRTKTSKQRSQHKWKLLHCEVCKLDSSFKNQHKCFFFFQICSISIHHLFRGEFRVHNNNLTQPLFIEVPVPRQESERSCIRVRGIAFVSFIPSCLFELGSVLMVLYLLSFLYLFS